MKIIVAVVNQIVISNESYIVMCMKDVFTGTVAHLTKWIGKATVLPQC